MMPDHLPIRILVVEDNPADAFLLHETLKQDSRTSFTSTQVESLAQALARLSTGPFDIVLLDLGLPDSQGPESLTRLFQAQPDVPVVVLTGLDDEDMGTRAVQLGAQDYLVKGNFPPFLLGRSIRYAIERKRSEQAVMAHVRQSAIADERNRMAGEIHDILAQDFVGILLQLEAALDLYTSNPREAAKCIELAQAVARSGLAEARRSAMALSPQKLDAEGLVGAVQGFLSRVGAGDPRALRFSLKGEPRSLPSDTALGVLRICQQAVVNALRHAQASQIQVQLKYEPSAVVLCVQDNGRGFDAGSLRSGGGFGLQSMRERAERIGAQLAIDAAPGQGTRLTVVAGTTSAQQT
jgi:signal transduction histidine kinase